MKKTFGRWLDAVGSTALLCGVLAFGTGCGALKAAANPKVAWALNDPAPMSVVVRRADVAEQTAKEVDTVLTDTPANDDSAWIAKVAPDKDAATKQMTDLKAHDLYAGGARVVAAEVWAKSLKSVEQSAKAPAATAAQPAQPAPEPAPAPKVAAKDVKAEGKGKGNKKAKVADAPAEPVAPAPAPAPAPAASKYPSLLAAIDKDLGGEWSKVMEKKKAIGDVKGQIAVLEAANDDKGTPDAQKTENKAKISELEKQIDSLDDEAQKLAKAFVPKAKAAAQKAPADVRDRIGPALVNLRQAVDDANIANGAAAVRYPMAATSLLDSAQQMAKIYVADVIEEKTGKRPSTQGIQPGVTLDGGKVGVTLNGLSQSDMGKIDAGELTSEVAARTTKWVKHAMGLLGTIASTKEVLELEDDVLGALIDGFSSAGWKAPAAATIPEAPAGPAGPPRS